MPKPVSSTGAVDRNLLKRANVIAAKSDTWVNALLNAQSRFLVETFEFADAGRNVNYAALLALALGRLDSAEGAWCYPAVSLPCYGLRVFTRAFLIFLENRGWVESAAEVVQAAVTAGRRFSAVRLP